MDTFIELEKEKQICINAIKQYNLKYKKTTLSPPFYQL